MPDWQPVAVPDLCSHCGAYWECEHSLRVVRDALTLAGLPPEVMADDGSYDEPDLDTLLEALRVKLEKAYARGPARYDRFLRALLKRHGVRADAS